MALVESSEHSHMLVSYLINMKPHFAIIKASDSAKTNLDEKVFIKFSSGIRLCNIIATSNNVFELKAQIPSQSGTEDDPIIIDDEYSADEEVNFQEPIDKEFDLEEPPDEDISQDEQSSKVMEMNDTVYSSSSDDEILDPISFGPNGTVISSLDYSTVNWYSYSTATRQLLTVLFSKSTLATHSLSGKPKKRRTKKKLDVNKIDDIIYIVMEKCKVRRSSVRQIISNKCSETEKLMQNRWTKMQEKKKK